jgi:photosystem II stability/assembly factor-like uncharacterized protein
MRYRGILLLAVFVALPAVADNDTWTAAGSLPAGGPTSRIVVNPVTPSIVYAAAELGLYESTDSGATWTRIFTTFWAPDVAIDPLNPSTLYLASPTVEGGLYKSIDGGKTWVRIDNGILGGQYETVDFLSSVAVDPVDEGVLYAGASNTGVYKSTDGGVHWSQINTGIITATRTVVNIPRLIVDPVTPNLLYAYVMSEAGTPAGTSLYRSTDSGATWTDTLDIPLTSMVT